MNAEGELLLTVSSAVLLLSVVFIFNNKSYDGQPQLFQRGRNKRDSAMVGAGGRSVAFGNVRQMPTCKHAWRLVNPVVGPSMQSVRKEKQHVRLNLLH